MRADKLLPGGGRLPLRCWGKAVALQDIADGLVTHRIAQVGQCPHDAVRAPRTIVLSHTNNQGLQLRVNFGAAWGLSLGGAVTLLGHELAVPAENRVGLTVRLTPRAAWLA